MTHKRDAVTATRHPKQQRQGNQQALKGRLVLLLAVLLLGFQFFSVSHDHDEHLSSFTDNCVICAASNVSDASGTIPADLTHVSLPQQVAPSRLPIDFNTSASSVTPFHSRAPPVIA